MVVTQTTNEIECFYYNQFNFTSFFATTFFVRMKHPHSSYCCEVENNNHNNKLIKIAFKSQRSYKIVTIHQESAQIIFALLIPNLSVGTAIGLKGWWTGENCIQRDQFCGEESLKGFFTVKVFPEVKQWISIEIQVFFFSQFIRGWMHPIFIGLRRTINHTYWNYNS